MRLVRLILMGLLAGFAVQGAPVSAQQDTIDISGPYLALESKVSGGSVYVEGAAVPVGIVDNTPEAAAFVLEKCIEFAFGGVTLEESFAGSRFVKISNPMAAYIPDTSPVAYVHPDLHETLIFDQSFAPTTRGCGIVMTSAKAVDGFEGMRGYLQNTQVYDNLFPGSLVLRTDTPLADLPPEAVGRVGWTADDVQYSQVFTRVNDSTGFIMTLFFTLGAE